jgi:hypothetical protein
MYFHLPPALPPFIVLASLPRKVVVDNLKDAMDCSSGFPSLCSIFGLRWPILDYAQLGRYGA